MLFSLSFGYLFCDTYSYFFVQKCFIDHLLCMVDLFRLSGTTDYCNLCYRWRQILAIGTEVLIFELVFSTGEEHVLELWLRHEHFSITSFRKIKTNVSLYFRFNKMFIIVIVMLGLRSPQISSWFWSQFATVRVVWLGSILVRPQDISALFNVTFGPACLRTRIFHVS